MVYGLFDQTIVNISQLSQNNDDNTGWWYTYPSEKYEFVSWEYEIPNSMESHKIHVPTTNQNNYQLLATSSFVANNFNDLNN